MHKSFLDLFENLQYYKYIKCPYKKKLLEFHLINGYKFHNIIIKLEFIVFIVRVLERAAASK
jgi:hypothetical protein